MKFYSLLLLLLLGLLPEQAAAQSSVRLYCGSAPCSYQGGALNVNATVSASITGFPGASPTTGTPISVTAIGTGVTGTLPSGTVVVASNVGTTNTAYCKLGATSTTSDQPIAPNGGWFAFTVGAATQLTCITSTSTTTVNMVGGAGIPTGTGGGGGGSGGGGAITAASGSYSSGALSSGSVASGAFASGSIASGALASGSMVDLGSQADSACGSDNGTCSAIALIKRGNQNTTTLNTSVNSDIPSVTGPLSAGAAAATKSLMVGGQYTSTQPTLTTTQQAALAFTARNAVIVAPGADNFAVQASIAAAQTIAVTNAGTFVVQAAQATAASLNATVVGTGTFAVQAASTLQAATANVGNVGGTSNVTPTDCSGTVTTGGTAQNAFTAQSTLRGFTIVNLSTDPMWISFTGTAVVGAAASYLLAAGSTTVQGGSFASPLGFGMNTALSLIAATTGDKFSCTRW